MVPQNDFSETRQLRLAHDFIQYTGANLFLTGKAGTGKTTFLKRLRELSPKRMVVTAPTGVAAINAGGVTIHSFFQLPFGPQIMSQQSADSGNNRSVDMNKFSREKINIIRSLDLLVIDEISMVRADLLDAIDRVLRRYKHRYKPFGGVQLLMIGDLQQLAPVVKDDEWVMLKEHYETPFFFSSQALAKTQFVTIELQHIFRQSDQRFIGLLNQIRENKLDRNGLEMLNSRCMPHFDPGSDDGYITLTTHNQQANKINDLKMAEINAPASEFRAEVTGNFPEYSFPTESRLLLKPGAQVMFARNDVSREKRFYNGKIGTITNIEEDLVTVTCAGGEEIVTEAVEWHNYTYTIDPETEEIRENLIGTFKQIPLKLAWAITIHKSQGLTFDKAIIDANAAFAHGQVYVALSRCRNLEGMVLRSPIDARRLKSDNSIQSFLQTVETNQPNEQDLLEARHAFERELLQELFDFIPIRQRLDYCTKLVRENEDILQGNPHRVCRDTTDQLRVDIMDVSRSFCLQIDRLLAKNPDSASNMELQDRLMKGCVYFSEKAQAVSSTFFDHFTLECDNKAVRKSILDVAEKIDDELRFKLTCLNAVREGFEVASFLDVKSRAGIDKAMVVPKTGKKPTKSIQTIEEAISTEILHPDLFLLLKNWRYQKAAEQKRPVYLILPQKSMTELVNALPQTLQELRKIKGLGDKKVHQYGAQILSIVADYCEANGLRKSLY
jgi:GTPase SAR1 family protein